MKRFSYAQNHQSMVRKALGGEWPCAYIQHDDMAWVPGDPGPPFSTIGIGVGSPSTDPLRARKYHGEKYVTGIAPPAADAGYDEACYSDYQVLFDPEDHKAVAVLINMQTSADANFWFRGTDGRSQVVIRPMNSTYTGLGVEQDVTVHRAWYPATGGTCFEALDAAVDPHHREHALMVVMRSSIDAWTPVASPATGDCDLTNEASYWQTGRSLHADLYESWDWQTWTLIGNIWSGTGAAHPFMHWPSCDYAVMLEWLPSGVLACAISYPVGWRTDKVWTAWPRPKVAGSPEQRHIGYEADGHKQQFSRVTEPLTTPWTFADVTWAAIQMAEPE